MITAPRRAHLPRRPPTAGDVLATLPSDRDLTAADIQAVEADALCLAPRERGALRRALGTRMATAADFSFMLYTLGYKEPQDPDPPETLPQIMGAAQDAAKAAGWVRPAPLPRRQAAGAAALIGTAPLSRAEQERGLRMLSGLACIDIDGLTLWARGPAAGEREVIAL